MSSPESPFNTIPPVALALVLVIAVIELAFQLRLMGFVGGQGVDDWRQMARDDWAFAPAVIDVMWERGLYTVDLLKRFVTYAFIHGSFTHALWATVLLLAMGKFVGEAYRPLPFLMIFFGSIVAGAVVYGLLASRNFPLIGAYPGIYGLIGAYTYLMWLTLGRMGENQYRAFTLIGMLMGLMLVYAMLFGSTPWWIAELAGFVTGLFLAPLVAPGGWRAFLSRLRQRR